MRQLRDTHDQGETEKENKVIDIADLRVAPQGNDSSLRIAQKVRTHIMRVLQGKNAGKCLDDLRRRPTRIHGKRTLVVERYAGAQGKRARA